MRVPASTHFTPIPLDAVFNRQQKSLPETLRLRDQERIGTHGAQVFRGIPFALGASRREDVVLLEQDAVAIALDNLTATYLLFIHCVEDRVSNYHAELANFAVDGNELGDAVSAYRLEYADGTTYEKTILRRFAIQQLRTSWGASPFAAVPVLADRVIPTSGDCDALGVPSTDGYGRGETRASSGRDSSSEHLWIYALPNPHPQKAIARVVCTPRSERSSIYALTATSLSDHPLRGHARQKARLTLPAGASLNATHALEDAEIDLGSVISARAALDYDEDHWSDSETVVQPLRSESDVIVEYSAHPQASLTVATGEGESIRYELGAAARGIQVINAAARPVTIRIVDKATGKPVAARLHMHGEAGEYLPPKGYHRQVNGRWFEDNYGEFVNGHVEYVYTWGECIADLPLGRVFVEISRGYEVTPIRTSVEVTQETHELLFELERVLDWRAAGWATADTHVHFLSPQTALLEGAAEGVNIVNLLASQWGEMFSNVSDFDGRSTFSARDLSSSGGDAGEFFVRVGTENRMQVLGHISLLGYSGAMIHPLCSGGPSESAFGDAQEVSMAEWAQRCIDQGGLTVMPHGPNPQCERAADLVLGLINAVEMMTFNPLNPGNGQINPYGIADWYRYLNLGLQVPICGGSDKMAASSLLGGIRTYAHLGGRALTYENWMEAMRGGNTFVTVGPLVELHVDGVAPGGQLHVGPSGGSVEVSWKVESVNVAIDLVEVVVGGEIYETATPTDPLSTAGSVQVRVSESTWIAVRVRGSYHGREGDIAAHTSAVQVLVDGRPIFNQPDAFRVLEQIEGALAYVDTLATRPQARRFRQLRATLEAAHNKLHQQLHRQGVYHAHTPLHGHEEGREH